MAQDVDTGTPQKSDIVEQTNTPLPKDIPTWQWEAIHGVPYGVEFFEIENFEHLNELTDTENVRSNVRLVDSYIADLITARQWKEDTSSYKKIVSEISKLIGIVDDEVSESKISKLANYIRMAQRAKIIEKRYE